MTSEAEYQCWNCGHEGTVIRATPEVPEWVRYGQNWHDEMEPKSDGEYVLHEQVSTVIDDLSRLLNDKQSRVDQLEAKLAQIEKQEVIGYFNGKVVFSNFGTDLLVISKCKGGAAPYALYTAPVASDADLRALALEISQYTDPDYIPREVFHRFRAALNPSEKSA